MGSVVRIFPAAAPGLTFGERLAQFRPSRRQIAAFRLGMTHGRAGDAAPYGALLDQATINRGYDVGRTITGALRWDRRR